MDANTILLGLAVLGGIGEALSLIPQIQSNGICQLVLQIIRKLSVKN
jgi:hypothetical protein